MAQFFVMLLVSFKLLNMFRTTRPLLAAFVGLVAVSLIAPSAAPAQTSGAQGQPAQGTPTADDQSSGQVRLRLPTITVTAQKEYDDVQHVPISVTAVTGETLDSAGVTSVSEAAQYAPNTFFNEFTARKLS